MYTDLREKMYLQLACSPVPSIHFNNIKTYYSSNQINNKCHPVILCIIRSRSKTNKTNTEIQAHSLPAQFTHFILFMIKANEMHYFSTLFHKELYVFRRDLLSIIRSLSTVFTAIGICHTSYVDCLLARSGWN
jgi:hypothetical protein